MNFIKRIIIIGLLIIIEPFSGYSQSFKDLDSMILHCVIDYATKWRMSILLSDGYEIDVNYRKKLWWLNKSWLLKQRIREITHDRDYDCYFDFLKDLEDDDNYDDEDEDYGDELFVDTRPNVWWLDCGSMVSPDFVNVYKDTLSKYEIMLFPNESPRDINKSIKKELKRGIQTMSVFTDIEGNSITISILPVLMYWRRPFIDTVELPDERKLFNILQGEAFGFTTPGAMIKTRFRYSPEDGSWVLFKK